MSYVVSLISAVYGVLSSVAALSGLKQNKKGDTAAMMVLGGLSLASAAGLCVFGYGFDWITALCGSLLISLAAFMNGKRSEFHPRHHVVRAIVEIVLVVGFLLW